MARKIWNELGTARALGINRGEETVTDNFLLDVQIAHPAEVATSSSTSRTKRSQVQTGSGG